eukprot:m.81083 g.81083  ORF g.81083 m.81083 type:complete len:118 (-) comp12044_c0_seq2:1042-1395(-)
MMEEDTAEMEEDKTSAVVVEDTVEMAGGRRTFGLGECTQEEVGHTVEEFAGPFEVVARVATFEAVVVDQERTEYHPWFCFTHKRERNEQKAHYKRASENKIKTFIFKRLTFLLVVVV